MTRKPAAKGVPALSESGIISRIAARFPAAAGRVVVGIGDDAAVIHTGDLADTARRLNTVDQVVTTDLLVEGVHFDLGYMSPADAGYKALAANISDIAAMGAEPVLVFGNLGVPRRAKPADLDALLDGVAGALPAGAVLAGGDTVAAPQWVIGFTVIGEVRGKALLRSGARPGDLVWHSGGLGLSQTGFHLLWSGDRVADDYTPALAAHRRPVPRLELARFLHGEGLATACLDLSDSLAQCLLLLAEASGAGLSLDFSRYPFDPVVEGYCRKLRRWKAGGPAAFSLPGRCSPDGRARRYACLAEYVLASAEDFQLLFTAPPSATARLLAASPVPLTRLGTVVDPGEGCHYRGEDGRTRELTRLGFEHL